MGGVYRGLGSWWGSTLQSRLASPVATQLLLYLTTPDNWGVSWIIELGDPICAFSNTRWGIGHHMTTVDQYSKALGITGCDTLIPHVLQGCISNPLICWAGSEDTLSRVIMASNLYGELCSHLQSQPRLKSETSLVAKATIYSSCKEELPIIISSIYYVRETERGMMALDRLIM